MQVFNIAEQMAQSAFRVGKNARVFAKHGLGWLRDGRTDTAVRLRQMFEELGATYIKMGQFIASAPSFFPEEYVTAFQDCLDKTPPLPFHVIRKVIEQELGGPLGQYYSWVDETPLASASIGQVHAAKTIAGHDVVVKVQKPGVENILRTDLQLVHTSSILLEKLFPQMKMASISAICQEMKVGMLQECDFMAEMYQLDNFRAFLLDKGITDVTAPQPYPHLSTKRLLTMERLYGVPFTDLDRVAHLTKDPEAALISGMNAWFATLLEGHYFHADVHAGNLLVLNDGRVAFIDFGIVGKVKPATWNGVQNLVTSLMSQDFKMMAQALYDIGMTEMTIDMDKFALDIQNLFGKTNHAHEAYDQTLMELSQVAKKYGIHFPREFALLMKQLLYFDRYVQLVSPHAGFYQDERLEFLL
ncbi:MAG: AarF/UbiB family protein [Pseudomonadota bacterium]|nr:AarF/UbiB family protein [Pseudomonadota bacterium]|tara:strand:- start:49 stop:1293 length:1245 start_codon:yes stop_codon:yes gene_type:complete